MSCKQCGSPCKGAYCKPCGMDRHREGTWNPGTDSEDDQTPECPHCGGGTHTEGEHCHKCKRALQIAPDLSNDDYQDTTEEASN